MAKSEPVHDAGAVADDPAAPAAEADLPSLPALPEIPALPEVPAAPASAPAPAALPAPALPAPPKLSKKERKLRKRQKDAHRPLDAWERYRALTDVLDEAMELVDLADHKARFALVIMAAHNVVLFFIGTRTELVQEIPAWLQPFLGGYVLIYVLIALYFFIQAIESLRPRKSQPQVAYSGETAFQEHPLGLRFYEDILGRDVEAYRRAWREVRLGQLNNELAVQAHALAAINRAKYAALARLYRGLKTMTLMAVGLVTVAALSTVVGTAKAGKHGRKNVSVLGVPERFGDVGAREPSGIAFDPGTSHLYLVGDEGSLWVLDASGARQRSLPASGNLEDVAVLSPGESLALLVEQPPQLILYDLATGRERRRLALDRPGLLGEAPGDAGSAFEGLAFRPSAEGGTLYLAHQRSPAMVVALAFDPAHPPETLGPEAVRGRWRVPGFGDLTAVTWSPDLQRLLLAADRRDRLLVLSPDGALEAEVPLPGEQQEGLAIDSDGTLWVADDQDRSVLRLGGAVATLDALLRARTASPRPTLP
jgi:uncharacterized protein YjiK